MATDLHLALAITIAVLAVQVTDASATAEHSQIERHLTAESRPDDIIRGCKDLAEVPCLARKDECGWESDTSRCYRHSGDDARECLGLGLGECINTQHCRWDYLARECFALVKVTDPCRSLEVWDCGGLCAWSNAERRCLSASKEVGKQSGGGQCRDLEERDCKGSDVCEWAENECLPMDGEPRDRPCEVLERKECSQSSSCEWDFDQCLRKEEENPCEELAETECRLQSSLCEWEANRCLLIGSEHGDDDLCLTLGKKECRQTDECYWDFDQCRVIVKVVEDGYEVCNGLWQMDCFIMVGYCIWNREEATCSKITGGDMPLEAVKQPLLDVCKDMSRSECLNNGSCTWGKDKKCFASSDGPTDTCKLLTRAGCQAERMCSWDEDRNKCTPSDAKDAGAFERLIGSPSGAATRKLLARVAPAKSIAQAHGQ